MAMLFRDRLLDSPTEVLGILRHPPEGRASCQEYQEQRNENGNRPSHRVSPCPAPPAPTKKRAQPEEKIRETATQTISAPLHSLLFPRIISLPACLGHVQS